MTLLDELEQFLKERLPNLPVEAHKHDWDNPLDFKAETLPTRYYIRSLDCLLIDSAYLFHPHPSYETNPKCFELTLESLNDFIEGVLNAKT